MSDFNEGDLVEFVKGKARIGGVVVQRSIGGLGIEDTGWTVLGLEHDGWTLKTVERAKPALPTEPGWYLDRHGMAWELKEFWNCKSLGTTIRPTSQLAAGFAPFTRLEPAPQTAKKVLDEVRHRALDSGQDSMTIRYLVLDNIASDFGVQS